MVLSIEELVFAMLLEAARHRYLVDESEDVDQPNLRFRIPILGADIIVTVEKELRSHELGSEEEPWRNHSRAVPDADES